MFVFILVLLVIFVTPILVLVFMVVFWAPFLIRDGKKGCFADISKLNTFL